jgi:hypothetical protein
LGVGLLGVLGVAMLGLSPVPADASRPLFGILEGEQDVTSVAAAPGGGFWVQLDKYPALPGFFGYGETLVKDGAPALENFGWRGSIAAIPGRNGYWVVDVWGNISSRGDAPQICNGQLSDCSGYRVQIEIVGAAATPSGNGLWALDREGKVWTTGDAQPYGDVQDDPQVPTGIVATPSGKGYYIVLEDGGVFSFGDAVFYGSTGGKKPGGHAVTGMALSVGDDGKSMAIGWSLRIAPSIPSARRRSGATPASPTGR